MRLEILAVFMCLALAAGDKELPEGFLKCSKKDPNLNACLIKAITESAPLMANGIPSLNIPPIEPLIVDNVVIDHGGSNSRFNLKSSFKNLVISGLTTSNLTKVAANFDKFRIKSESYTERLDLTGNYEMNGQIIFLPITGEGFANISMHQMISVHDVKGDYYVKPEDGETYVNITDYKIKFKPKYVTFAFGNLFNGDKVLGDTMNQFMNQNWKAVFNGLIPEYAKFFGSKFSSIANNVFQNVPIKNIFLD